MFRSSLILLFFTQLLSLSSNGQYNIPNLPLDSINYDLFVDDEMIGEFCVVKRLGEDSTIVYTGKSDVDYKLLFSFHISFLYASTFSNKGELKKSTFTYLMNDDVKESNWINCVGDKCYVYEDNQVKKIIDNQVSVTGVQLYFEEPTGKEFVFSERFCDSYEMEKEGDRVYKVDFPGGSTNRYHYKDGICYKVEINSIFSDMEFRRRGY